MANTHDASRPRRKNYAYAPTYNVSDWRLPIYDAEHVRLAVQAVGPHPPHGNPPDIPAEAMPEVRSRIAAALRKHISDPAERDALIHQLFGHSEGASAKGDICAVKSLPDGRIGGYLVVFGSSQQRDLQGEYFTPQTDFALDWSDKRPVLYHHGLDAKAATALVGTLDTLHADDVGLWAEAQLNKRSAFVKKIEELIAAGALSWSSGSLGHLVRKERDGRITRWPLIEGSLTPTPAEPRLTHVTHLTPAKAIEAAYKSLGLSTDFLLDEPDTPLSPGPFPPVHVGKWGAKSGSPMDSPSPALWERETGGEVNPVPQSLVHLNRSEANEDIPMTDGATIPSTGLASPAIDPGAIQAAVSAALAEAFSNSPRSTGEGTVLRASKTLPSPQSAHSPHVTVIVDGKSPRISMMKDQRFEDWTAADMAFFHTMMSDLNARQPLGSKSVNRIAQRFLSEVHADPDHRFEREMAHKAHREIAAKRLSEAEAELILAVLPYKSVEAVWANDYQAIKANELDTTTQAGYGQEYVPSIWRDTIWARIRIANAVAQNMVAVNMPTNPFYIALEQADPTIYYVGETTDAASLVYNASNAISLSKIASAKATLTAKKLAGRVGFSMELSEDALPFLVPQ
ncbi:MAG TPA: HK97 family phage prohead protease, partial [Aggregatilineales bacterium]|nr:HK97 family phage prohead protease [Aggregatilineales bacterium]